LEIYLGEVEEVGVELGELKNLGELRNLKRNLMRNLMRNPSHPHHPS